jgi:hypothetical protein
MFTLLTSYYDAKNDERQKELDTCLLNNYNNVYIEKIYLFVDNIYIFNFIHDTCNKIFQIIVDDDNKSRLSYKFVIEYMNNNLKNEQCIIANSDIYFDDTLKLITKEHLHDTVLALSRYDDNSLKVSVDSQDSWITISPLNINLDQCNFKFGFPGCDNRFAFICHINNYRVINPCYTIKTHHLHNTQYRTYSENDRIIGEYLCLQFTYL